MNSQSTPIKKLYYSIGEVSAMTGLKQYVLRYWETEFKQLRPPKNKAGNRTYRQKDIDFILRIKNLLYSRKFTIEGARGELKGEQGEKAGSPATARPQLVISKDNQEILRTVKQELNTILELLQER